MPETTAFSHKHANAL